MSIGNGMSLSDGIGCIWKRFDIYEQNIVSDQDMLSDSNGCHSAKQEEVGTVRSSIQSHSLH